MCSPSFRESVEDDERSGRPSTSKTDENVDKTVFMDYNGVVHHELLPKGLTINKQYYLEVKRRFREPIHQKRPDSWESRNAGSNNVIVIRTFLIKNGTNTIQQPPNSTDLTPCDFFLFSRLKKSLRGPRFSSQEEIMKKSKTALMAKPKTEYKKCFEDWIKC